MKNNKFLLLNLTIALCFCISLSVSADDHKRWSHDSEASLILTDGNTETTALNFNQKTVRHFAKDELTFYGHYTRNEDNKVVGAGATANNWDVGLRFDHYLTNQLSLFLNHQWEGDDFTNIEHRNNNDIGVKYVFWKDGELDYFHSELGYRYTKETYLDFTWAEKHNLRAYAEASKTINENLSAKLWVEYVPNIDDFGDYLLNAEASIAASLSSVFSLKVAYLWKHDSTIAAPVLENNDSTITTSLLAEY